MFNVPFTPPKHRSIYSDAILAANALNDTKKQETKQWIFSKVFTTSLRTWCYECQYKNSETGQTCGKPMYPTWHHWLNQQVVVRRREKLYPDTDYGGDFDHIFCKDCKVKDHNEYARMLFPYYIQDRHMDPHKLSCIEAVKKRIEIRLMQTRKDLTYSPSVEKAFDKWMVKLFILDELLKQESPTAVALRFKAFASKKQKQQPRAPLKINKPFSFSSSPSSSTSSPVIIATGAPGHTGTILEMLQQPTSMIVDRPSTPPPPSHAKTPFNTPQKK